MVGPDVTTATELGREVLLSRIRTGDWLDAQYFPPVSWVVPGVMPEGFGLLIGAPKMGKSWLTLDLCLALAMGGRALGAIDVGPARPVLLLALEDGERRLQDRARHLLGDKPIPSMLHYATECEPGTIFATMEAWLSMYGNHRPLIVLDTLGRVMPPTARGENDYQRDYRMGSWLKSLCDKYPGTCICAVHHTRKASSEDWADSTSGTQGLNGSADWTCSLSRPRSETSGRLKVMGRDVMDGDYAVTFTDACWTLDGTDLSEAAKNAAMATVSDGVGDLMGEVLAFVVSHPEGTTAVEVGAALTMSNNDAGTYLRRAADAGRIAKIGRGKFAPIPLSEVSECLNPDQPFRQTDTSYTLFGQDLEEGVIR
ncbi:MAG: AAA family ATPase [Propionibacteriaceae bacterium]